MCANPIPVSQAKYKLLNREKDWKSRVVTSSLAIIIVASLFVICAWLNILAPIYLQSINKERKDNYLLSTNQVDNAPIVTWTRRAGMYAESTKKNENSIRDRTTNNITNLSSSESSSTKIVVCYYTIPGELNSTWELSPNDIEPHICSHIIVGFASVVNCTISLGLVSKVLHEIINIKNYQPKLKVMLSVGGGSGSSDNSNGFSFMVKNHQNRKLFIQSVLNVFNNYHLDGIDIDWEFPNWLGIYEREKIYFIQLLQELKKEFIKRKLIISAAVAAPSAIVDQSYILPELAENVDFINLMSYDYHFYVWYLPLTGLNAPLYSKSSENGYMATLNVNYSAAYWLSEGMPRDKIVIGIPSYGHTYLLDNPFNNKIGAPAKGFGQLGTDGFVDYSDVCSFIKKGAYKVYDKESQTPYAFLDNQWVSFDDETSVLEKVLWIKKNDFKGAMIFSLNTDDWKSTCNNNITFPLTRILSNEFLNTSSSA